MKRAGQMLFGLGVACLLIWAMFRNIDLDEFWRAVSGAHVEWLLLMLIPTMISFVTRIFRWGYIVRTAAPVSFRDMFSATQIGFLVNFSLPGRVGELVRAGVLTRLTKIPFTKSFAFCALDRVTDLFGLTVVAVIAVSALKNVPPFILPAALSPMSSDFTISASWIRWIALRTEIALLAFMLVLVLLYIKQELVIGLTHKIFSAIAPRFADKIARSMTHFAEGFHIFRSASDMLKSIAWSLVTWACFIVSLVCLLRAFDFHGPWFTVFVVQALLALFVSLPVTPGLVGQFQLPIVAGLLWLVSPITPAQAMAAAVVSHVINLAAIFGTGGICMFWERKRLFNGTGILLHPESLAPPSVQEQD